MRVGRSWGLLALVVACSANSTGMDLLEATEAGGAGGSVRSRVSGGAGGDHDSGQSGGLGARSGDSSSGGESTAEAGSGGIANPGSGGSSGESGNAGSSGSGQSGAAGSEGSEGGSGGASEGGTGGEGGGSCEASSASQYCEEFCECIGEWCSDTEIPEGQCCFDFCAAFEVSEDDRNCRMNQCLLVEPQPNNNHCEYAVGDDVCP
jgi:hypothetical protein